MKTAIIYYSLEGNMEYLAKEIAAKHQADLIKLVPAKEYPTGKVSKYIWGGKSATFGEKPRLSNGIIDLTSYETLIIGTPIWAGTMTPPFNTFLSDTKISGKNIILLATCSGGSPEKCFTKMKEYLKGNTILAEFQFIDPLKNQGGKTRSKIEQICSLIKNEKETGMSGNSKDKSQINNRKNPVIAGQFADPDIDIFGDKYYLYPTTDGFTGWSGTQFHVFSSDNLIDWKDEGIILDVASEDVPWSVGSAWAPTIEERNGKYYYYFCAKNMSGDSCIGVAVADSPIGPFKAEKEPLMTVDICKKHGVRMGQAIDPSIYTDEDKTAYLMFGNGDAAIVKLNEDMISADLSTLQNYSGVNEFREAITVTKREGVYHFTWSCDDTGSPDYHINYGISDSIYGPIEFQYTVLQKDESKDILGTGHHCILHIPNSDDYYMVYHRFVTPLGMYKEGFGFHRETCIDVLKFDQNSGLMQPVSPTNEGIKERYIKNVI